MLKNQGIGEEEFVIASYQMNDKGKIALPAIAGIFQEIAGEHAHANGFGFRQMIEKGHIWVLTRLKIKINSQPAWGDKVDVATWIVNREKFFSRRDFLINDKNGNKLIAAASGWMLLSVQSKRPQLVENIEMDIPMFPDKFSMDAALDKIPPVEFVESQMDYLVRYSDLDINKHVNNLQYIRIFLDAFPYNWINSREIKFFEINYLSEAAIDEELEIITGTRKGEGDTTFFQELIRRKDNKVICRAKTEWT